MRSWLNKHHTWEINPFATGDAYMRQLFYCLQWYASSERVNNIIELNDPKYHGNKYKRIIFLAHLWVCFSGSLQQTLLFLVILYMLLSILIVSLKINTTTTTLQAKICIVSFVTSWHHLETLWWRHMTWLFSNNF